MNMLEVMEARHSVRQYTEKKIEQEKRQVLQDCIDECNKDGGLHIQVIFDEPECFHSIMAHYGKFEGVSNYIALAGKKGPDLDEKCGYYGERIVLKAQELGLNTCWVAGTYGRGKCKAEVGPDEKLVCVISLGYGKTQGVPHKNRDLSEVCNCADNMPDWFAEGMKAVMFAPTAMNQQRFYFALNGDAVTAKAKVGPFTKLDLGIVKYHFTAVTGKACI